MTAVQLMRNAYASLFIIEKGTALRKLIAPFLMVMVLTKMGQRKRLNQPKVVKRSPIVFLLMKSYGLNVQLLDIINDWAACSGIARCPLIFYIPRSYALTTD